MTPTEPRGMTIPDLVWLTVGVAVAAALGSYSALVAPKLPGGGLAWDWFFTETFLVEILRRGCLVMIPVVVARRARYGGALSPVEFAALSDGLSYALERLENHPWFAPEVRGPGSSSYTFVPEIGMVWCLVIAEVGLVALMVAVIRRHRRPDWATSLLVWMGWVGLTVGGLYLAGQWARARLTFLWEPRILSWIARYVRYLTPMFTLANVPLAAALVQLAGPRWKRLTWAGWAVSCLLVARTLITQWRCVIWFYEAARTGNRGQPIEYHLTIYGSLGLAILLVLALRPAWRRFFAIEGPGAQGPEDPGSSRRLTSGASI